MNGLEILAQQLGKANDEIEKLKTANATLQTETDELRKRLTRAEKEDGRRRDCILAIAGVSLKEARDIANKNDYRVRVAYEDGQYCPKSGPDVCDTGEISVSVVKGTVVGQRATDKWGKPVTVPHAHFPYGMCY